LRLASFEARAGHRPQGEQDALWREGELSGSRMVAAEAKRKREELAEA